MALQMTFMLPAGSNIASLKNDPNITIYIAPTDTTIANGYIKVESVYATKSEIECNLIFKQNRDSGAWLIQKSYSFTPSLAEGAPNFIKQAYEYVKELDEYAGAIDVFE